MGAFSPVMRTHHGTEAKSNWSFESDDETLAHWARYAKVHISLAPYLRTLAQQAHDTGIAIMRPLALGFPSEAEAWPIKDQYMLGPSMLVAPVITQGQTSRSVLLPAGTWYPWLGGAPLHVSATTTVSADTPVAEIPVYAMPGAVIPTYPDGVDTLTVEPSTATNASSVSDDRVVYAFAGRSGGFVEAYRGPSFTLEATGTAPGAPSATYNGGLLAACAATPVAPCLQTNADGVRAYVTGPGTLEVSRSGASFLKVGVLTKTTAANYQLVVRY
jgi:alpha-glucosidase (family GH31 glycosyl hydrolase)